MATMISLCRLVMVCAALVLGACATRGGLSEVRKSLSWDGDLITWTVENPTAHSIIIDDYTETDMGVPVGVWIRVTEATGERLAYSNDNDGWHSPWIMWSSAWTRQPLELAPSARLRHTFTATDLAVGIRVTSPIASARCRYQLRVAVSDPDLRGRTVQVSDWRHRMRGAANPILPNGTRRWGQPFSELQRWPASRGFASRYTGVVALAPAVVVSLQTAPEFENWSASLRDACAAEPRAPTFKD